MGHRWYNRCMKRIISYGVSVITSTNVATHVSTTKLAKYSSCKGVCSDLCDRLAAKQEKINGETTDVILDVTMGTSVRGEGEWTTVGATDVTITSTEDSSCKGV
ncbi:unnamed protein product [Ilex paraguariensis]|uniref:Uncharacterized protein n=1 Tax=Ilex paraguariensis TaxID=185542 RepID=A0ABC8UWU4_9AQUA